VTDDSNPNATRLLTLRKTIAKEYNIDDDDWRVRRLSSLTAAHAAVEDQLACGEAIDIGHLLQLGEAIETIRSSLRLAEPTTITVRVAERLVGICPLCRGEVEDYTPPPPKPPAPPPIPEAPPAVAKAPAPAPAPARRARPVVASSVSPLSYGGYDPARHSDSPLSWGPHPYIRKDGQ
jgi:hypothetical protein